MYIVLLKSGKFASVDLSRLTEAISLATEELFKKVKEEAERLFESLLSKSAKGSIDKVFHRKLKDVKQRYASIRRCLQLRIIHTIHSRIICLMYISISYLENLQKKLIRLLFRKQDRGVKHIPMMTCKILYYVNSIIGGKYDRRKFVLDL